MKLVARTEGRVANYTVLARQMRVGSVRMKCLLLYYAICADHRTGKFFKSYLDIYLDTGITERTARSINKALEKQGILTRTEPALDSGHSTDYQLHAEAMQLNVEAFKTDRDKKAAAQRAKATERIRKWRALKKKQQAETLQPAVTVAAT